MEETTVTSTEAAVSCEVCHKPYTPKNGKIKLRVDGSPMVPRNWKIIGGVLTCDDCRKKHREVRTLRWPIHQVVSTTEIDNNSVKVVIRGRKHAFARYYSLEEKGLPVRTKKMSDEVFNQKLLDWSRKKIKEKADFKILSASLAVDPQRFLAPRWEDCRRAVTFIVQRMFQLERLPIVGDKIEPFSKPDEMKVKHEISRNWPWMTHVCDSIFQDISAQYRAKRYFVLARGENDLLSFRNGIPIPIRATMWRPLPMSEEHQLPRIEITFSKNPDDPEATAAQRMVLELQGGRKYAWFISTFKRLFAISAEEKAYQCRMTLDLEKKTRFRSQAKIYALLSLDLPKRERVSQPHGTLFIDTLDDAFIGYSVSERKRKLGRISGDNIRRLIVAYHKRLARMADDQKHELRTNPRRSDYLDNARKRASNNSNNAINSFIEETTTQLANYAERKCFATVVVNLTPTRWSKGIPFPWFRFNLRLQQKMESRRIEYTTAAALEEQVRESKNLAITLKEEDADRLHEGKRRVTRLLSEQKKIEQDGAAKMFSGSVA